MPRCFVERCNTFGRKKVSSPYIVLHVFPNSLDKIKTWLRCIERSGQAIENVDNMAERIYKGKRSDKFRICSEHFTEQSYVPFGLRKTLKKDAIPTIFHNVPPEDLCEESLEPPRKKALADYSSVPNATQGDGKRRPALKPSSNRSLDLINISPLLNPGHQQGDLANRDSTIRSTECFQQPSTETKTSCTDKDKSKITQRIYNLTLEIIYLLTGEECVVKSGESVTPSTHPRVSDGLSINQGSITVLPPTHEKINDQKILELTFKIIQLLTGEVPIRCEDDTVSFAMDKLDNLEGHKDQKKNLMMENHLHLRTPDILVNKLGEYTATPIKEESVLHEEGSLTDTDMYTATGHIQSSPTDIKEESYEEENLTDDGVYTPTDLTLYTSTRIKEESVAFEEGDLTDTDMYTSTDHKPYTSTRIKEETVSSEEENLTDTDDYSPADHSSLHIKEVSVSDEEDNLTDTDMYTPTGHTRYASNYVGEETDSCDDEHVTDTYIPTNYTPHTSTHTEHTPAMFENNHMQKDFLGFDEGTSIDTDVCALIKHAHTKFTFAPIEEGSASEEDEIPVDTQTYASKDHKKPKSTPAVDECVSGEEGSSSSVKKETSYKCSECPETFIRRSDFANHRRDHRRERLTCPECGKVFSNKPSLLNHLTGHTGEKPYSCPVCGKCFTRNSNLIVHQAVHMERSPLGARNVGEVLYVKQIL
ncbi:oocyte zinc finger protein XlCOF7.1-like isoform X2 [Pseudophryne corroboree]|uniref:oocyte zinc finger protein XlCOF7.1-like isoform X2 n=1 Tax=Pseudophryne corroboree TaxID=495146 RepID=UPI003081B1F1